MATPTRGRVRCAVLKRVTFRENRESSTRKDFWVLDDVTRKSNEQFSSLDTRLCLVEVESDCLEQRLEVARRVKYNDRMMEPVDTMKVVFDSSLHFSVHHFAEVISEGDLIAVDDVGGLVRLQKMCDEKY